MESTTNENCAEQLRPLHSENQSLSSIHRFWGFPKDDEILWLLDQGVSEKALWPVSGATVRFAGATFDLDHEGERELTFRAEDRGEVIDLVAWQRQTGALASWRGKPFALETQTTSLTQRPTLQAALCASAGLAAIRPRWHRDCAAGLGTCLSC